MDRLCTQCIYCSPWPVDYRERLYDRFHLSAHNGGERHFLHVQTDRNKWDMLYVRTAVPQMSPVPARRKSRIACGDILLDACSFFSRVEIDGLELVGRQWFAALHGASSGLPLRPLFVVVKNGRVILHSVQQLTMRKAQPRVAINKVVLELKCDKASFDAALWHSIVLSLKWVGTHCSAADGLQDPAKTREQRRLNEDELRVDRIIARHMKSVAKSID